MRGARVDQCLHPRQSSQRVEALQELGLAASAADVATSASAPTKSTPRSKRKTPSAPSSEHARKSQRSKATVNYSEDLVDQSYGKRCGCHLVRVRVKVIVHIQVVRHWLLASACAYLTL